MNPSIDLPSNRKFGLLFAFIFLFLSLWIYWKGNGYFFVVFFFFSLFFFFLSAIFPDKLSKLNRLWFNFGLLLAKIFNPLILGVIFFVLITPVAVMSKLFGRDELGIKSKNKSPATYWKSREPVGPDANSFKNQY